VPVRIHYEDDIFFLQAMIKTLKAATELDIDLEFFKDKLIEDTFFIDSTLLRIFGSLKENEQLLNRKQYLRSVLRAKNVFVEFLQSLFDSPLAHTEELAPYISKLRACQESNEQDIREIQEILQTDYDREPQEDVVSQEEFRWLLEDEDNNG
jgi:hypothetical protein